MIWNFGEKLGQFAFRPPELDRKITIECGSVRSGKTWSFQPKMLYASSPDFKVAGRKIVFGISKETIYRDVLCDLIDVVGVDNFERNKQSGDFSICGCPWQCVGARDEGSEKFLRGATIGMAFGHELTAMPQSFFHMLLSRLSPAGARLYGTTNPDNPYHWLKQEIIDNRKMIEAGDIEYIHTTMEDNPNLTQEFVQQQKRQFSGLFYQRFIEGRWVMASGAIFGSCWSDDLLYDDSSRPPGLYAKGGYQAHLIGIDYGTTNPCVFLDVYDDGRDLWIDDEYYWDSAAEMRQKTDQEYADDLQKFIQESGGMKVSGRGPQIVIDPSAASFKLELQNRGFWVTDADNEVQEGISRVMSAMSQKKIRVHRQNCPKFVQEHQTYSWDDKKAARGVEEPIKSNDHTCDANRYVCAEVFKSWRLMS